MRRPDESVRVIGNSIVLQLIMTIVFFVKSMHCIRFRLISSKFVSTQNLFFQTKPGQCGPGEEGTEIQIDFDITESMVCNRVVCITSDVQSMAVCIIDYGPI